MSRQVEPIPVRRMAFDFESIESPFFYDNNAIISSIVAALSAVFPPGEREFVRSVNHYKERIKDPALLEQIRAFAGQEGHHANQHRLLNEMLDSLGFDVTRISELTEQEIKDKVVPLGWRYRLASTVGLEHITAILAEFFLTSPEFMEPMPPPMRDLLKWHAVEEIEHKAVAFEVYDRCVGDRDMLRKMMAVQTFFFIFDTSRFQRQLLRWMGHRASWRERVQTLRWLFGAKGVIPAIARPYLRFYRKDFHPWQHDNRALIEKWKKESGTEPEREAA